MQINLYKGSLEIGDNKGICIITAYDKNQAKEIAEEYWNGYKDASGEIEVEQISGITCECNVSTSLKVLCGNSLEEIMNMGKIKKDDSTYQIGDYTFDSMRQNLTHKDGEVEGLTTKENDLLMMLCSVANRLVDRDVLLEKIWGESSYYTSRSMDVYITKLRKHFVKDTRIELLNVHGKGFKFIIPEN